MKLLILTCLLAVSRAAPLAGPDDNDDNEKGPDFRSGSYVSSGRVPHSVFTGYQPVSYAAHGPVSFAPGTQVFQSVHPSRVAYTSGAHFGAIGVAKHESGEEGSVAVHGSSPVAYTSGALYVPSEHVRYSVQQAAVPTVTTYNAAHHQAVVPAHATQIVAAAPTFSVGHAAPVQYRAAVQVAPAVATAPFKYDAQVATVAVAHTQQAAVAAIPTAITYQSEHTVELASKEIDVPVQNTYVYRPVEQRINYETENYVAGSKTIIHKPKLSAPAIAPPQVFKTKTLYAAPEVTVHHKEETVHKSSPNYIAAPYDAGVVVEQATPEIKQVDVPTPVEVPHAVAVPTPYHVKVAQPVKVKSSISPVVNVDVHSVRTENVVSPVKYTAHHHLATVPVVATSQAVATGQYVAQAPKAVVYGAAVPFGQAVTFDAGQAVKQGAGHFVTFDAGQAAAYGAGQAVTFDAGQAVKQGAGHFVTFDAGQAAAYGAGQAVTFNAGQAATSGTGQVVTYGAGLTGSANPGFVSGAHGYNQFAVGVPAGYAGTQQFTFTGVPSGAIFTEKKEGGAGQFVQGNYGQIIYPQQFGGPGFSVAGTPTVTTYSAGTGSLERS